MIRKLHTESTSAELEGGCERREAWKADYPKKRISKALTRDSSRAPRVKDLEIEYLSQ